MIRTRSTAQTHLLVLAAGTRMPADDPRLTLLAGVVAARGVEVLRFELGHEEGGAAEEDARMEQAYRALLETLAFGGRLVIGGWSLGGRIAAGIVEHTRAAGLVCLSYPFHPIGEPKQLAAKERLAAVEVPTLVVQGTRDAHGNREQVRGYALPGSIELRWQADANHGLQPRARSGFCAEQQLRTAGEDIARFVLSL